MPPRCQLLSGSLLIPSRLVRSHQSAHRSFTTSTPLSKAKGGDLGSHLPKHVIPKDAIIPDYPHGPSMLFKQSNKGLYGGQTIQFGNNVSPDTETKTRRHWKPNILTKGLYSVALKKKIKLRVTSKVLKTMDREGGLDEYLLKESDTRIKELGPIGWALRWTLMQTPEVIARFRAKAAALGLPQEVIDQQWPKQPVYKQQARDVQAEQATAEGAQDTETPPNERRSGRITRKQKYYMAQKLAEEFKTKKLAPRDKHAQQMAAVETSRILRAMNTFGSQELIDSLGGNAKSTVLAYRVALKSGEVDAAGGKPGWLAERLARRMWKAEKQQLKRGSAQVESPSDESVAQAEEWGDLVKANNKETRV